MLIYPKWPIITIINIIIIIIIIIITFTPFVGDARLKWSGLLSTNLFFSLLRRTNRKKKKTLCAITFSSAQYPKR